MKRRRLGLILACCLANMDLGRGSDPVFKNKADLPKVHAAPAQCELPFLGKIKASVKAVPVMWKGADGKTYFMTIKMFYTQDGRWFRGEYARPGVPDKARPVKVMEKLLGWQGIRYTGIPKKEPTISLNEILQNLHTQIEFDRATRFNISYLLMNSKPYIVLNVWGVRTAWPAGDWADDTKRVAIQYDLEDGMFIEDDIL